MNDVEMHGIFTKSLLFYHRPRYDSQPEEEEEEEPGRLYLCMRVGPLLPEGLGSTQWVLDSFGTFVLEYY